MIAGFVLFVGVILLGLLLGTVAHYLGYPIFPLQPFYCEAEIKDWDGEK